MKESNSREVNSWSITQGIHSILQNHEVHNHVHISMCHWSLYILPPHFLKNYFNGIPHLCLGLQSDLFQLPAPEFIWVSHFSHECYMSQAPFPTWFTTIYTKLSPSWKAKNCSIKHEITSILENKSSIPCSQQPASGPDPKPDESSLCTFTLFL
jgi:hypothetical protein